jgi:broad specificity phosphatase PhoE
LSRFDYVSIEDLVQDGYEAGLTVLLRHAERHPLRGPADVVDAGLTGDGSQTAREFGERLANKWRIERVFSSPIQRCLDTGQNILDGAGVQGPIHAKWWLFSPFLKAENGHNQTGETVQISGDKTLSTIDKQKLAMVLRRIRLPDQPGRMNLYITHDTTILPLAAHLLGVDRVTMEDIPGYLQGIALVRRDGQTFLLTADQILR